MRGASIHQEYGLLRIRPYSMKSLVRKHREKLALEYFGPYKILECIGEVAYCVELFLELR